LSRIEKFLLLLACVTGLLSLFFYPINAAGDGIASSPKLQVFCGLTLMVVAAGYALEDTVLRYRLLSGIVICTISHPSQTTSLTAESTTAGSGFWTAAIAAWALGWLGVEQLAAVVSRNQLLSVLRTRPQLCGSISSKPS